MSVLTAPADFPGTNTDKIDKLIVAVIELRSMVRMCYYFVAAGFPLLITLLAFMLAKIYETSAKVDRLADNIGYIQRDVAELKGRVDRVEARTAKLP